MPAEQMRGWANSPTDVWMTPGVPGDSAFHYDGTFFAQYTAKGRPVGTASDMLTFDFSTLGGPATVTEWTGGFSGTMTSGPGLLGGTSVWRTADGHIFVADRGLVVH